MFALTVAIPLIFGVLAAVIVASILRNSLMWVGIIFVGLGAVGFAGKVIVESGACGMRWLRDLAVPETVVCYPEDGMIMMLLTVFVVPSFLIGLVIGGLLIRRMRRRNAMS